MCSTRIFPVFLFTSISTRAAPNVAGQGARAPGDTAASNDRFVRELRACNPRLPVGRLCHRVEDAEEALLEAPRDLRCAGLNAPDELGLPDVLTTECDRIHLRCVRELVREHLRGERRLGGLRSPHKRRREV